MRVVALLAAYNEERFVADCLGHYLANGVEVYLLDNDSTDATAAIARQFLGHGLIGIESLPRDGTFRLRTQLARKEELAATLPGDWFLHADLDEVRLPPRPDQTLGEALAEAEADGFNAVNFQEFTFVPTREAPDHDHPDYRCTMHWYYPFLPFHPHRLNAWKRQPARVELGRAGHEVRFPGQRVFPERFVMRHYLFLSREQAIRKYVQRRYAPEEVSFGWHGRRATLRAEEVVLPGQKELRLASPNTPLDGSNPRTQHLIFSTRRAAA